jgi:hypothetical protein
MFKKKLSTLNHYFKYLIKLICFNILNVKFFFFLTVLKRNYVNIYCLFLLNIIFLIFLISIYIQESIMTVYLFYIYYIYINFIKVFKIKTRNIK